MKKIKIVLSLIALTALMSCEDPVNQDYILKSYEEVQLEAEYESMLTSHKAFASDLKEEVAYMKEAKTFGVYPFDQRWELMVEQMKLEEEVFVDDQVRDIFDPDKCPCSLPKKVKKKLLKLKDKDENWAPAEVISFLNEFPDFATKLEGESISSLMHRVKIKSTNSSTNNWILLGSPSFDDFSIDKFLVTKGFNSFLYSLDCSGYLNAAIEASGAIPGADIKTEAKAALTEPSSMIVGGGVLLSPIQAAYYGNEAFGVNLTNEDRIAILKAVISIPNVVNSDSVIVSTSYEVMWASNQGSSSFNGKGSFGGSGKAGVGLANISASGNAGGEVSRTSSFSTFNTYYTSRKKLDDQKAFTIADVKNKIDELTPSEPEEESPL